MILEMQDICKEFPMGKSVTKVLKNVNLTVDEGDYLAIMGHDVTVYEQRKQLGGMLRYGIPTYRQYGLSPRDIT